MTTPPIPDYESAHAVAGGTGAAVLRHFARTDRVSFAACSEILPAGQNCRDDQRETRRLQAFSQTSAENRLSRVLIGSTSPTRRTRASPEGAASEPSPSTI